MEKIAIIIILVILSSLYPSGKSFAAAITVSGGQSIQSAVSSANSGDIIGVNQGTYNEKINISKSGITLKALGKVNTNAITVSGNGNTVSGFTISDSSADAGIRVQSDNNLIEKNEIFNTKQDGIWFFGSNNIFRGNYIHDIIDPSRSGDPHADCFQTWEWNWDVENVIFEKNICDHTRSSGSNQILMLQGGSGARSIKNISFRNNIFIMHDAGYSPLNFHRKSGQAEVSGMNVINNTFYNTTNNGQAAIKMIDITDSKIINNVSIGYGNLASATGGNVTQSNNVQSGELGMVNYQNLDFHLLSSSPLIDKGIISGITDDFDGIQRPQGAGFDIGAFEFRAGISTSPTINTSPSVQISQPAGEKLGDADSNGNVDGVDYVIWLNNYNKDISRGKSFGDFDGNGFVDGVDYVVWLNNYGK